MNVALRVATAIALVGALAACNVDLSLANLPDGFACATDDDCVAGFFCDNRGEPAGTVGRCVDESATPADDCVDRDQDGAFVGAECPAGRPIDCDDENNAIGPTANEVCDGIDNDCDCDRVSGDTNNDGVICGVGDDNVDEEQPALSCPLQVGLCGGTTRECVDGTYQDCAVEGLYGEDFEATEVSCDGIDNDCDGTADEQCACIPGEDTAVECGSDTGTCERGVQFCLDDGSLSGCVVTEEPKVCANGDRCVSDADCVDSSACERETCEDAGDCGEGGYCVVELLDYRESLDDDCTADSQAGCSRSVCRYPITTGASCEDNDGCTAQERCVNGTCMRRATAPVDEICNGEDDNCNGAIDDDFQRNDICGPCPFNSSFLSIITPAANPDFVCADWYEASRPDATAEDAGTNELYTLPRAGVLPWTGLSAAAAESACRGEDLLEASGGVRSPVPVRRLCLAFEWRQACGGTTGTAEEVDFPYSPSMAEDFFREGVCNDGTLALSGPQPTGSATGCCRGNDTQGFICDMSGNVAEYIENQTGVPQLAGGSYLDTDGAALSCGDGVAYAPVPADAAERDDIGFRCCTTRAR